MPLSFWDVYARVYDELGATHPYLDLHRQALDLLDPQPHERILDLGCGTGLFLRRLAHTQLLLELSGVDASPAMIASAKRKLGYDAAFIRRDANDPLPYRDGSFDAVVCMQVLYTLADPATVLREIRRVLRPGGRLILANPHTPDRNALLRAHYAWVFHGTERLSFLREARLAAAFAALYALNGYIVKRAGDRRYHFLSPPDLGSLVEASGFRVETILARTYGETSALLLAHRS